jgi:hypothetical protein
MGHHLNGPQGYQRRGPWYSYPCQTPIATFITSSVEQILHKGPIEIKKIQHDPPTVAPKTLEQDIEK